MLPPFNPRKRLLLQNRSKSNRDCPRFTIRFRNGRFEIPGADAWYTYWQEPYYLLLTVPWWGFLLITTLSYIGINALFAVIYLLGGDCIDNATPGSFGDAFFFSVQTLTSIGYGSMSPSTFYADAMVTIEALVGTTGIALMTGLAFTKFSQPTAKVIFSRVAVISDYNNVPTLMLRTGNKRHNQIIQAEMRLYLMRDEVSAEGNYMRRFHQLKLVRKETPRFTLSWTVMHQIDETSPLYGATAESLAKTRTMLVVSFSGIDETVAQSIHAPYSYAANQILWGQSFVDIIQRSPEGHHFIDYGYFHHTEPAVQNTD